MTLFFVLSGFVLVYTYGSSARIGLRSFLGARVARLFPVYLAALVIAVPEFVRNILPWSGGAGLSPRDIAVMATATPLMLQAWLPRIGCYWNCPAWSLSAEAFFYLMFPLCSSLLFARHTTTLLACAVGAWILALASAGLRMMPAESFGRVEFIGALAGSTMTPLFRLPEFLLGAVIGRWYLDRRLRGEPLHPERGQVAVVAAAACIAIIAATSVPVPASPMLGVWLLPFFAALVLGLGEHVNGGLLAHPRAMQLGEASYAFYLIHGPLHGYVLGAARRLVPGSLTEHAWSVFLVYAAIVLTVSLLLYRYLERPARHALRLRFDTLGERRVR